MEDFFLASMSLLTEKHSQNSDIIGQYFGVYQSLSASLRPKLSWTICGKWVQFRMCLRLLTSYYDYGGEDINVFDRSLAFFWNISILDSVKYLLSVCGIVDLTLQLMRKAIPTRVDHTL